MSQSKTPNNLVHSSSPYLKQHAYNPVNWYPWGKEALQLARDKDKPMIISIGYSACHWCHVMERESFENEEIAKVMNEGFVCIKVDREERPDVDQIYMEAIQTMGINGGWPLNVFAMPDQKPFYGGTYFKPKQWLHILKSVVDAYKNKITQLRESANEFAKAILLTDTEKYGFSEQELSFTKKDLNQLVFSMKDHFDRKEGGLNRAPKFPNPTIWKFLLAANAVIKDKEIHEHIMLTLSKIAKGGIYDHIGGGFARYSVDQRWFAPHFEKMLYDNGQLISLFSMAYQLEKNELFREVVYESVEFVKRELMSSDYGFYSALDADSEGEEGNYYIWEEQELDALLGPDSELVKAYYHTENSGNWERGFNILYTTKTQIEFAKEHNVAIDAFRGILQKAKTTLLNNRKKRIRPGLDDKILTSWNALMTKGLIDAYHAFGEKDFLDFAEKSACFIHDNLMEGQAVVRSYTAGHNSIDGFLDDYAFTIDAFLSLYQVNFETKWLELAIQLVNYAIEHFYDYSEELFFYTNEKAEELIARKKEIFDNVIPASNSVMAQNLYFLGILTEQESYLEISKSMISKIAPMIKSEPQYLTNWGTLFSFHTYPGVEIAILGDQHISYAHEIQKRFLPNKVIDASDQPNDQPLLTGRNAIDGKTTIYVCFNKSCKLPVHSVEEALKQIEDAFPTA